MKKLFKWMFLISFSLTLILYFYKDQLPEPSEYIPFPLNVPTQTETSRTPFTIHANHQDYKITPKFNYDLTGVVVSYNNANGFTDIWHYDLWKDFINIRDLCVIWGVNVKAGIYKKLTFSHDTWTCWVAWDDSALNTIFKFSGFSNNHLLTDNNAIKTAVMNAEVGDVIHFKGILTDYKIEATGAKRETSIRRDDTGNGACEIVYLDEFKVIKKVNVTLRRIYLLSKWIAIFSLIGFLIMYLASPVEASN